MQADGKKLTPRVTDKISFWDDSLETSHVALYNQAFEQTDTALDYYPSSGFDTETTATKEPILVVDGIRLPCNYWDNLFFRAIMSSTANTRVKDATAAAARTRLAPLWG